MFHPGWRFSSSPLSRRLTLGERLFSGHMVEHEFLMAVAAPLLVLGRPLIAFLWALPQSARRDLGSLSRARLVSRVWLFRYERIGGLGGSRARLMGLAFARPVRGSSGERARSFAAACLFPRGRAALLDLAAASPPRCRGPWCGRHIFVCYHAAQQHFGALLTLGTVAWYPLYGGRAAAWGLTAIEDQQLAGLVMWVPGGLVYMGAAPGPRRNVAGRGGDAPPAVGRLPS